MTDKKKIAILGGGVSAMTAACYLTEKDKKATDHFYENIFLKIFPKGGYLDVQGNWILTNQPELFT